MTTTFGFRCWACGAVESAGRSAEDMGRTPPSRERECRHGIPAVARVYYSPFICARSLGVGLQALELLLGHRRVELLEDRGGLDDLLADRDRVVRPGGRRGVVAGDDRVAGAAVEVLDLVDAG